MAEGLPGMANQISGTDRGQLESTAVIRYKQKLAEIKRTQTEKEFSLEELMALIDTKLDVHDFVERTELGDEMSMYIKPFVIATRENVDREVGPHTTDYTKVMENELAVQRELKAATHRRIRELENGLGLREETGSRRAGDVQLRRRHHGSD